MDVQSDAQHTPGVAETLPPPDIEAMRAIVRPLLVKDAIQPAPDDLAALATVLRTHMELLISEVGKAAGLLPRDDIPRYCALACIGEARGKLRTLPDRDPRGAFVHARKLARSLNALCDHWETLHGVRPAVTW